MRRLRHLLLRIEDRFVEWLFPELFPTTDTRPDRTDAP